MLVRATTAARSARVQKEIEQRFPNAQVASAKQVADQISGSLVDASNLSHRLGVALAIARRGRRVPARRAAHALLGRQARARARDAEGARLDAAARRPAGRRRVARAGRRRRPARRRARRRSSRAAIGAFGADADRELDDRRRRRRRSASARSPRARSATSVSLDARRSRRRCSLLGFGARARRRPDRRRRGRVPRRAPAAGRRAEDGRVMDGPLYDAPRASSRVFSKGDRDDRARVDGVDLDDRRRRVRRARGPERLGQDDAAPAPRRARPAERRPGALRGPRPRRAPRPRARRAAAARVRLRLPAVQPDPDADRAENVEAALAPTGVDGRELRERVARRCSPRSASPTAPSICRASSRAASSSASRSRARSSVEPRVILADEPTGNLDTKTGADVIDLLAEPRRAARRDGRRRDPRRRPRRARAAAARDARRRDRRRRADAGLTLRAS